MPETLMDWIGQEVQVCQPLFPSELFGQPSAFKALASLGDRSRFYVHFTDEETEAWRGSGVWPQSCNQRAVWALRPQLSDLPGCTVASIAPRESCALQQVTSALRATVSSPLNVVNP